MTGPRVYSPQDRRAGQSIDSTHWQSESDSESESESDTWQWKSWDRRQDPKTWQWKSGDRWQDPNARQWKSWDHLDRAGGRHRCRAPAMQRKPRSGKVYTMFHGTSAANAARIRRSGFKPATGGMLGPGVYLSRDRRKAEKYG